MRLLRILLTMLPILVGPAGGAEAQTEPRGAVRPAPETPVATARRVALVIGNGAYRHTGALRNPANDARRMAAVLERAGFAVILGVDLDRGAMEGRIRDFGRRLDGGQLGLFFYAGHGLQANGENYLLPVDAQLQYESDLGLEAIPLALVLRSMEGRTRTNLVFLDSCRDNPLARNLARTMGSRSSNVGPGLAPVASGEGTLVSFATAPNAVALDGDGPNSPFTTALAEHLTAPGLNVSVAMQRVRGAVLEATGRRQVPWDHSSLTGEVVLVPAVAAAPAPSPPPPPPASPPAALADRETVFWQSAMASGARSDFEAYLSAFPNGAYAALARNRLAAAQAPPPVSAPSFPAQPGPAPPGPALGNPGLPPTDAPGRSEERQFALQRAQEEEARRVSVQRAALLLGVEGGLSGRWSTGDCRDATRTYEVEIRDGHIVWTHPGSVNVERIEASDDKGIRTSTTMSRHRVGRSEAVGTTWIYTESNERIRVQNVARGAAFTLVRCR